MTAQWALALHRMRSRSSSEPLREEHPTAPWTVRRTRFRTVLVTLAVLLPALAIAAADGRGPDAGAGGDRAPAAGRAASAGAAAARGARRLPGRGRARAGELRGPLLGRQAGELDWPARRPRSSAFVRLVAERPDDYDSRIALADVRRWRGETAAAREVLEDLRRTHPDDPEVLQRLDALHRAAPPARWEADLEYFGERLPGGSAANGGTLSLEARVPAERLRWRAAATLQEKFDRTESRAGGELGLRPHAILELAGSAFLAPGAEVLPRQSYGLGLSRKIGRRLVVYADYAFLDYRDAQVHQAGPELELYAGRWLFAGRYRYAATRFAGTAASVDDHGGSLAVGFLYGPRQPRPDLRRRGRRVVHPALARPHRPVRRAHRRCRLAPLPHPGLRRRGALRPPGPLRRRGPGLLQPAGAAAVVTSAEAGLLAALTAAAALLLAALLPLNWWHRRGDARAARLRQSLEPMLAGWAERGRRAGGGRVARAAAARRRADRAGRLPRGAARARSRTRRSGPARPSGAPGSPAGRSRCSATARRRGGSRAAGSPAGWETPGRSRCWSSGSGTATRRCGGRRSARSASSAPWRRWATSPRRSRRWAGGATCSSSWR